MSHMDGDGVKAETGKEAAGRYVRGPFPSLSVSFLKTSLGNRKRDHTSLAWAFMLYDTVVSPSLIMCEQICHHLSGLWLTAGIQWIKASWFKGHVIAGLEPAERQNRATRCSFISHSFSFLCTLWYWEHVEDVYIFPGKIGWRSAAAGTIPSRNEEWGQHWGIPYSLVTTCKMECSFEGYCFKT